MKIINGSYLDQNNEFQTGTIEIEGDSIKAITTSETLMNPEEPVFDATDYWIFPGLINTHTHLPMGLMRGIADHLPLDRWLKEVIFPVEEKYVSPEFAYYGALLGAIELIKSGTTTAVDMYYHSTAIAKALERVGMRGYLGVSGSMARDQDSEEASFIERFKDHRLIQPSLFAHAIYTTPESDIRWVKETADRYNLTYQFHLLETEGENSNFKAEQGMDLLPYLESIDFLSERLIAAHCVWCTDSDIEYLKKYHVTVAHNPHSNLKLNSGVMPLKKMVDRGINITLGTDGAASNNHLDILLEMDTAAKLYYIKGGEPVKPGVILDMATRNGGKALMNGKLGVIQPGARGDLLFVKKDHYTMFPGINPISSMVFSHPAEAIDSVMINGEWVMRGRKLVQCDEEALLKEISDYLKTLGLGKYYV